MKKPMTRKRAIIRANIVLTICFLVLMSIIPLKNWEMNTSTPLWQWAMIAVIYVVWMFAMNKVMRLPMRREDAITSWHQLQLDFKENDKKKA